jgi:factor associated with neutral sphingomyelinase activation
VAQTAFLAEVNRLFAISRLPAYEADDIMKQIVLEREASTVFDMTWMESLSEKPLMELFAVKVTPLVINAGRLMITQMNVYFQPINNVDANPIEKYPLKVRNTSNFYRIIMLTPVI